MSSSSQDELSSIQTDLSKISQLSSKFKLTNPPVVNFFFRSNDDGTVSITSDANDTYRPVLKAFHKKSPGKKKQSFPAYEKAIEGIMSYPTHSDTDRALSSIMGDTIWNAEECVLASKVLSALSEQLKTVKNTRNESSADPKVRRLGSVCTAPMSLELSNQLDSMQKRISEACHSRLSALGLEPGMRISGFEDTTVEEMGVEDLTPLALCSLAFGMNAATSRAVKSILETKCALYDWTNTHTDETEIRKQANLGVMRNGIQKFEEVINEQSGNEDLCVGLVKDFAQLNGFFEENANQSEWLERVFRASQVSANVEDLVGRLTT